MTRLEFSGQRSLEFSRWIRKELPDSSTGFCVGNNDWIFWNYHTRRLMLCEEKTRNGDIKKGSWFHRLITEVLDPALKEFSKKNRIDYRGYHLITFEKTDPSAGKIYLDRKEISKEDLKDFLSMKKI